MLAWISCLWGLEPFCGAWWFEKLFLPGLIAYFVYRLAVRQLKKKREIDFAEKKLTEFYAPMVAARAEILNFTIFDRILRNASQLVDIRKQKESKRTITPPDLAEIDNYGRELKTFFEGLNKRLLSEGIDAYIRMRKLFAEKLAFADEDTQPWYDYFYSFVEMWNVTRTNKGEQFISPPVEATVGAMFDEELLQPFYAHLRERAAHYQSEIGGKHRSKAQAPSPPSTEPSALVHRLKSNPLLKNFLRIEGEADEGQ